MYPYIMAPVAYSLQIRLFGAPVTQEFVEFERIDEDSTHQHGILL